MCDTPMVGGGLGVIWQIGILSLCPPCQNARMTECQIHNQKYKLNI